MKESEVKLPALIGMIGGTGKEGKGLAYRWAKARLNVVIGSRQQEKAEAAAGEVNTLLRGKATVSGTINFRAAETADLVVLTVPYAAHAEMCATIKPSVRGKIVVDVTVPLVPPKITRVQMPPEGSAARQAQLILGEDVQVVAAFQNISYEHLLKDEAVDCDVIVCGGNCEARAVVIKLVEAAGLVGWDGGPLDNAMVVEGLTSILLGLNKKYSTSSAGIRITGIPRKG